MPAKDPYYDFALTLEQGVALKVLIRHFLNEHESGTSELCEQLKAIHKRLNKAPWEKA